MMAHILSQDLAQAGMTLCLSTPGGGHCLRIAAVAPEALQDGRWDYDSVLLTVVPALGQEVTIALTPVEIRQYLLGALAYEAQRAEDAAQADWEQERRAALDWSSREMERLPRDPTQEA